MQWIRQPRLKSAGRSRRRRSGVREDAGRSACRTLAGDDDGHVRRCPQLLRRRRRVGAGQRQRNAAAAAFTQHADGVPALTTLVQSHHARRLGAPTGLHVGREDAGPGAPPERLQSALPRGPATRRLRPRLQRSVVQSPTSTTTQRVQRIRRRVRRGQDAPPESSTRAAASSTAVPYGAAVV